MHEIISLAKDNALLVVGLLLVTLYLQGQINGVEDSIRQELSTFQIETTDRLARIETYLEQLIEAKPD